MADDKRNAELATYQKQIADLKNPNQGTRLALARDSDVRPEVLYYLAEDKDKDVRSAVAQNPSTPGKADLLLADDVDPYVRTELARKIGRLLPGMSDKKETRLRELTEQALDHLANDRLVDVRAALADAIRDSDIVPKQIVMKLAQDVEEIVAAPILEYSPLLNDADLVEIIGAGVTLGALPSIARRRGISADVADAVVATTDLPSVAALLHNKSASVRSETLDKLTDGVKDIDMLHEPLVMRPELSQRAIRRISTFVARSMLDRLAERGDLDNRTRRALAEAVGERLAEDKDADQKLDEDFAEHLNERGKLDDEVIQKAMEKNRRSFVVRALALKSGRKDEAVERIMAMRNGKATTALVHQAGLSMRTALLVQQRIARVPPHELLAARNGVDYPMTAEELEMQIAHIG